MLWNFCFKFQYGLLRAYDDLRCEKLPAHSNHLENPTTENRQVFLDLRKLKLEKTLHHILPQAKLTFNILQTQISLSADRCKSYWCLLKYSVCLSSTNPSLGIFKEIIGVIIKISIEASVPNSTIGYQGYTMTPGLKTLGSLQLSRKLHNCKSSIICKLKDNRIRQKILASAHGRKSFCCFVENPVYWSTNPSATKKSQRI